MTLRTEFLVDVHDTVAPDFIASMADHLETALSWRVDIKPSIPVLRYECTDGIQRIVVMENLPLPESMTKKEIAPPHVADLARTNALKALRGEPTAPDRLLEAFAQLNNFAILCAEAMDCGNAEKVIVRAPTPWSPLSIRCMDDAKRTIRNPSVLRLAPPLYEIGTSGDSSLADTSLSLYTSPASSGRRDAVAVLRATNELTSWHAAG